MTVRVDVEPRLLAWATERSRRDPVYLNQRFPLEQWERGERKPTLRQLENFARATYTSLGYLLLPEPPPEEQLPIPDFRTLRDESIRRPSPNLLDTIYQCEQRQEWYREFARVSGEDPVDFIGVLDVGADVTEAANRIRDSLDFSVETRRGFRTWTEAFRAFIDHAEDAGVLVMVNGVVGNNTHRPLDPEEFRGFALVDPLAPVVFINGADTKAAQIFTFTHEVVHLWVGQSGVDNPIADVRSDLDLERWCNEVAAELLVPHESLRVEYNDEEALEDEIDRLARVYKVSTLVALRSLFDADLIGWDDYRQTYSGELERLEELSQDGGGGNFYNTAPVRASKRFTRAIITSTLQGESQPQEAFRLLGVRKMETLHGLAESLDIE